MSEPALKEVPKLDEPTVVESTAKERFEAQKKAKREAKASKVMPEKLLDADKNLWLLHVECVKRHEAELIAARLSAKHAETQLQRAIDNHQTALKDLYARYKMKFEVDGADLNTGIIQRKGNGAS